MMRNSSLMYYTRVICIVRIVSYIVNYAVLNPGVLYKLYIYNFVRPLAIFGRINN